MFFSKSAVRKAVQEIIEPRIVEAEERLQENVREINRETSEQVRAIVESSELRKEHALELCVNSVLN